MGSPRKTSEDKMTIIQQGLETLIRNGLVELLVFTLVFAVVFGVLESIELFGDGSKRFNVLIALAIGGLTIIPSIITPGGRYDVVAVIKNALPQTMLILVLVLCVIIILGLFGITNSILGENSWMKPVIALILTGVVIYIFTGASGRYWRLPYWMTPDLIAVAVALIVFGLVVFFVMKEDPQKASSGEKADKPKDE
jgi:hypothetical protein